MKRMLAVAVAATLGAVASPAAGQEDADRQFVVARSFQCSPQGGGIAWLQAWRPIVQEMIAEGSFVDYGIMAHAWGDEWNVVDFFVVEDLSAFHTDFAELVRRAVERDIPAPTYENSEGETVERAPFGQICTRHKDNIYALVAPPGGD